MKKKCFICGAFCFDTMDTGGQPVKTRNLYRLVSEEYGKENVICVDTCDWKKHPINMFFSVLKAVKKSNRIIMLPAHNGVKVFAPLLLALVGKSKKKLYYDVIGGWLPLKTANDPKLAKKLKKFDGIWVETESMKSKLEGQGFDNIDVVPNFKFLTPITKAEFPELLKPYKLCTFSRVTEEKGIEVAINAVKSVNEKFGEVIYTLDIYGQIDNRYSERFECLKKEFPPYIKYCGIANPDDSVDVLKNYFALLFPTKFYTEGIPGTIIDAYAAGVPVISSRWENFEYIIQDDVTGIGYEFDDKQGLLNCMHKIFNDSDWWNGLKINCLKSYENYSPENVIKVLVQHLT